VRTQQERNAAIIKAEGESEAAKLISFATRQYGFGLIELRKIEVTRRAHTSRGL
jgi:prohibitin 1